jgi:RNase P subunit RPR2
VDEKSNARLLKWQCTECDTVLGYLDPQAEELRIKLRDLYIWIYGGSVQVTCRKCGALNRLMQADLSTEKEIQNHTGRK